MMSPETIHDMAAKAARKAAREKKVPLVVEAEDILLLRSGEYLRKHGPGIPFLGKYIPKGWNRTGETFFVDSSGFGGDGEQALTFEKFVDRMKPGLGYAVIKAGQFQVYVAEFTPPRAK